MGVVPKLAISRKVLQILYEKIRKNCHFRKKSKFDEKSEDYFEKKRSEKL